MRNIIVAAILSVVAACAGGAPEPDGGAKDALLRALLPPASLGGNLSLSQLVVGEYQDQKHSFHAEVEVTAARMVVVGLSSMGVPIFTLEQDAGAVKVETPGADSFPFDPRHILSDFQIAYWPEAVLRDKFESVGLRVREGASQATREVLAAGGELVVRVTYLVNDDPESDIIIEHFAPPYRLRIKTFDSSESP